MTRFDTEYERWMRVQLETEKGSRRKEKLEAGLGHGSIEFLKRVWLPAFGNLDHLYAEWEVRDLNGKYRYIDLAYRPGSGSGFAKGAIEIQGYGPHARDLDVRRFKDLCWRHSLLALEEWTLLHIAYPSIHEETERCRQLVLAFAGKCTVLAPDPSERLSWIEAETLRFARRSLIPFAAGQLADHLRVSPQHARRVLHTLVERGSLAIASGRLRYRTYKLPD
ncbi:transcriptional regulator [Saccharibacillus alkalitolerans]|uniref:Transcriptional regulator n=1 Tax=Saccharibacillus alkalitolerans TaxID=2705290 RepID=A0ABX0F9U4_9BACL|nr:transcriptional regulator [Saccharibacillus alkalitolerans]NGZ77195.1 transcriptional regulator [Saccharibacillus alkalitolerans]